MSNPPPGSVRSQTIALWKDAKSRGPTAIDLPQDADAVILTLAGDFFKEYSADGRDDDHASAYPVLAGILPVQQEQGT